VIIRPIRQIRGKTKQSMQLCVLASKTKQADSHRQFTKLVYTPRHPTFTNKKKPVTIRPIRQIRGKTQQTLRLCALANKTKQADLLRQFTKLVYTPRHPTSTNKKNL
jgi:hypothetical protein